jgi:septation ring formation regulator EzrA
VLSKPKDIYPDFKYIDILNSQLQSFQLKFTERLENRLSSKIIKVLLSNRKLTGRKQIAFDNNVHKIAIFSDELENVKQLNFSLQRLESDNIEFENKGSDLHNSLQEEICLKGVLLAKQQNLSNQLDSLKNTNSCLRDYVKSINKKFGTANSEKDFSEITENNKSRKIKEFKSKAETALWFVESCGLVPQYLKL